MAPDPHEPPETVVGAPTPARTYNALTGGDDHRSVDLRTIADFVAKWPTIAGLAPAQRAYALRAVRYLAEERGIDQFLELGCGLPGDPQIHDVVRVAHPAAAVVYVDNDASVLAHAKATYDSGPRTAYIEADVSDPEVILRHPSTRKLLDFSRPMAITMFTVWHYVPDQAGPAQKIAAYADATAAGSYLAMSHGITDGAAPELIADLHAVYPSGQFPRPLSQVEPMLAGLTLVEPWTDVQVWRNLEPQELAELRIVGAIGRKD